MGYAIIKELKEEGWIIESEYSKDMFDKGIDMDGYLLVKEKRKLDFTWDNWTEWTVEGKVEAIEEVSALLLKRETERPNQTGEAIGTRRAAPPSDTSL